MENIMKPSEELFPSLRLVRLFAAGSTSAFEASSGKAACQSKALGWTARSLMALLPSRMVWSRRVNCLAHGAVLIQRLSWQISTWISLPA